jgi:serine/threonine protein kinase
MGEVYRARDTRLDCSVAIKILPAHLCCDPARKLRFEREAKTVSALNHPNICSADFYCSLCGREWHVAGFYRWRALAAL